MLTWHSTYLNPIVACSKLYQEIDHYNILAYDKLFEFDCNLSRFSLYNHSELRYRNSKCVKMFGKMLLRLNYET